MNRTDYSAPSRVRSAPLTVHTDRARPHSFDAVAQATPTREAKKAFGRPYRVGVSTVEKWHRAYGGVFDNGRRNPLDKIAAAIEAVLAAGVPFAKATAPLSYLCRRFGGEFVRRSVAPVSPDDHAALVARIARGGGDLAAFMAEALADGVLDIDERQELRGKLDELLQAWVDAEALGEVYPA